MRKKILKFGKKNWNKILKKNKNKKFLKKKKNEKK